MYTTVDNISEELNGYSISTSSIPSSSTVTRWIEEADSIINERTGITWGQTTYTNEYYDYDGLDS